MTYTRFEWLTIGVGTTAILATIVYSFQPGPDYVEMMAQLMLLVVLVSAVHWGRRGGVVGATAATLGYIVLRSPFFVSSGVTVPLAQLVIIRMVTYGFVGIVGGEVCGRIKYFFARLEDRLNVDDDTRVFNQRFVGKLLVNHTGAFRRYGAPFSVVILRLSPDLTAELHPSKAHRLVRAVADYIRNDVRLVDDVGILDDGRFVLILPHTPKPGGEVASERVRSGVRDLLGAKEESITAQVMGAEKDLDAIHSLALGIAPEEAALAMVPARHSPDDATAATQSVTDDEAAAED